MNPEQVKIKKKILEILERKEDSFYDFTAIMESASGPHFRQEILPYAFLQAILNNKISEVNFLFWIWGEDLPLDKALDEDGNTALMCACAESSLEMVELLIKRTKYLNENLKITNKNSYTPYLKALLQGRKEIVDYLESLDPGIIGATTIGGNNAFICAARQGKVVLMERVYKAAPYLLKQNLKTDQVFCEQTPFMHATFSGSVEAMDFIFKRDPDALKAPHEYPLMRLAVKSKSIPAMEFILAHDKDALELNCCGDPVEAAGEVGSIPILEFILKHNPEAISRMGSESYGVLQKAIINGHLDVVKYALSKGARVFYTPESGQWRYGIPPNEEPPIIKEYMKRVREIFDFVRDNNIKGIQEWVAQDNTINFKDTHDNTLLHYACQLGKKDVAFYLIEQGLSLEALGGGKMTPLMLGMAKGQIETVFSIFTYRANKINNTLENDIERSKKIKELRDEFEGLIKYAEVEHSHKKMDYEFLAIHYDKKYWKKMAEECYQFKRRKSLTFDRATDRYLTSEFCNKEYCQNREKLIPLIYTGTVICHENENETLEFEVFTGIEETEEERCNRLKWALKFSIEAQDLSSAMRILMEMTLDTTLPEVASASQSALKCKSTEDFILRFAELNFRNKIKKTESEERLDKLKLEPAG